MSHDIVTVIISVDPFKCHGFSYHLILNKSNIIKIWDIIKTNMSCSDHDSQYLHENYYMNNSSCSDSEDDHHKMKWSDHFCGECNNLIKTNHNYSCVTCDLKTQTIKRDERNMTDFQKRAKVIDDKTDQEWQPKASDYFAGEYEDKFVPKDSFFHKKCGFKCGLCTNFCCNTCACVYSHPQLEQSMKICETCKNSISVEMIQKKIIGQRIVAVTNRKRKVENRMACIEQMLAAMKLKHVVVVNELDSLQKLLDDMGNVQV